MRIDVLTLFPEMLFGYLNASILQRAQEAGLVSFHLHNIRDYAAGKHRITDDPPYGGGGGMVLKPEPLFAAVESILGKAPTTEQDEEELIRQSPGSASFPPVILMTPQGRLFKQEVAQEFAQHERILLICGRYEGVDERVRQRLVTDELSIGDYVLTGGELPAMVVVDAVVRCLPGVLGAEDAAETDSHATGLLEGPHYTRPERFREWVVPEVLRSGHAANIARWRREQALRRTWQRRPELLLKAVLSEEDKQFLILLAEETSDP
jgi:tRNA (guanine37-N1)-methyltransferase